MGEETYKITSSLQHSLLNCILSFDIPLKLHKQCDYSKKTDCLHNSEIKKRKLLIDNFAFFMITIIKYIKIIKLML